MGTQSSSLRPVPDPARTAIVDPKTGMLTTDGFWFLYLLFRGAQAAEGTAILEAIDAGTEGTLIPQIRDLFREQVSFLEAPPLVTKQQIEDTLSLGQFEQPGVIGSQLEEVSRLSYIGDTTSLLQRLEALEKLVATINDQPLPIPEWTTWTPTVTGAPTFTTSSLNAKWVQYGKTVHYWISAHFNVTVGGSPFRFTLPVPALSGSGKDQSGCGSCLAVGAGSLDSIPVRILGILPATVEAQGGASNAYAFPVSTNVFVMLSGTYQAA